MIPGMIVKCSVVVVAGVLLACCSGGCASASIAAAGGISGIATAISTGGDVYRLGKLDSADQMCYDLWVAACRSAVADLHYNVEKQADKGKGVWMCTMRDDRRSRVDITVDRRTEMICLTRIDVGVFGSEPTARLILSSIRRRARPADATQPSAPNSDEILEKGR